METDENIELCFWKKKKKKCYYLRTFIMQAKRPIKNEIEFSRDGRFVSWIINPQTDALNQLGRSIKHISIVRWLESHKI